MKVGRSYKQHGIPAAPGGWDAIVIGSGLGGLTTAALLARHGKKRVLVLERHYTAGGFTHVFHRPGYDWDVGVHYVGDVHRPGTLLRRLFDHLSDGALAWADMGEVTGKRFFMEKALPASVERFLGPVLGPARFEARHLRPRTPVPGLFLTGSDICTAGVGGALLGGFMAATVIGKRNAIADALAAPV